MAEYTPKLNLFKNDVKEDGKKPFSIKQSLNDNWDKIDTAFSNIPTGSITRAEVESLLSSSKEALLQGLYPIGSLYLEVGTYGGTCSLTKPDLLPNSRWVLVAQNQCIQGSGNYAPGTQVAAGLPNITASWTVDNAHNIDGKVCTVGTGSKSGATGGKGWEYPCNFDARGGNTIYGNSNTVQPPAYVVNIWQRIS